MDPLTAAAAWYEPVLAWLSVQGLAVVYAIIVLFVGWRVARAVAHWSEIWMEKSDRMDPMVEQFLSSFIYYFILAVVLITVLHLFGVQTTSLVAVIGAASLAIGLALQGSLTSLAAGIMILLIRPFRIGDYIAVRNHAGTVKKITLFLTELATFDNIQVILPNSDCWGTAVVNYSGYPTRMLDIDVGIDYDDDIEAGFATLRRIAEADPRVLKEPAPDVFVEALGDSSVDLKLRLWTNAGDYWPLRRDLTRLAKQTLELDGLQIPFPHRTIVEKSAGEPETAPAAAPAQGPAAGPAQGPKRSSGRRRRPRAATAS
jgi:small conductance mechanosensitive channel